MSNPQKRKLIIFATILLLLVGVGTFFFIFIHEGSGGSGGDSDSSFVPFIPIFTAAFVPLYANKNKGEETLDSRAKWILLLLLGGVMAILFVTLLIWFV